MKQIIIILLAVTAFSLTSCLKEKSSPIIIEVVPKDSTCLDTISFANEIMNEIMTPLCTSCHLGGASCGGFDLSTHANVTLNATIVLKTLNHDNGVVAMPQGGSKINDSLITKFECWITQGKLDN